MSRLDQLISYVDELDKKSNRLLDSIYDSTEIIQRISYLGLKSIEIDNELDNLRAIIWNNSQCLQQYNDLKQKSELISNNFDVNDLYTNQTNYDNLNCEYNLVLQKFLINDQNIAFNPQINLANQNENQKLAHIDHHPIYNPIPPPNHQLQVSNQLQVNQESQPEAASDFHSDIDTLKSINLEIQTPTLSNKLSLSNLKLKPIRCNNKKVYKKKSCYRLSSIYNINPIAYDELNSTDCFNSPTQNYDDFDNNDCNNHEDKHTPYLQDLKYDTPSRHSKRINDFDNISTEISHDDNNNFENYQDDSTVTTVDNNSCLNPKSRNRSNSLPEANTSSLFSSFALMKPSNIFSHYESQNLRNTRLQHFISQRELRPQTTDITDFNDVLLSSKNNIQDIDDISIFSDEEDQFENENQEFSFNSYLRQSRNNLLENFPNTPKKSSLHDSVLSKPTITVASSFKFNNPGKSIKLSTPTVEPTLANLDTGAIQMKDIKRKCSNIKDDPKIILNDFILRNNKTVQKYCPNDTPKSPKISPKPSLMDILQFNSASSAKSEQIKSNTQPTRRHSASGSIDAWASNLLHLVNSSKEEIPQKIRELKAQSIIKPISVENNIQKKRKPIRIPGSQSRLIIELRNTKIIHGESSPFRRPVISKVRHTSLHEALSQSML